MSYHGELPGDPAVAVYVNATTPTTATIFSLVSPPTTHNAALMADSNNVYFGTDGSAWAWNGSSYVTAPNVPKTEFYIGGSTTDAGGNKTSAIYRPGKVGFSGTANFNPVNGVDIAASMGVGYVATTAATYAPSATDVAVHLTGNLVQTVTMPSATTFPRRLLWLVNPTAFVKNLSAAFVDVDGFMYGHIPANSSVLLQASTAGSWRKLTGTEATTYANPGSLQQKKTTSDIVIVNWATPYSRPSISELDIIVPNGKTLTARYVLRMRTANAGYAPSGLRLRGLWPGDRYTANLRFPNVNSAASASGGNWYDFWFNEARPDSDPAQGRGIDASMVANLITPFYLTVSYENLSGGPSTFGWDFGNDLNGWDTTNVNISCLAGSTVTYSIT